MSKEKSLVIRIEGDSKQLRKEIDKIKDQTKNLEKNLKAIATGSGVAFAALTVIMGATVKAFASFETALIGVGKTADLSGKELDDFGSTIQDLSTELPFAANELLGIAKTAGQLGVKGKANLLKFTETIAKLGTASDLAGEEAATALTRILNVTGEGIETIDNFASVIVALGNSFAATEREIARSTTEVARSTAIFKVSAAEAAALGATLTSLGIRAEGGGTAVGRAFREIDRSIREAGLSLDTLSKLTGIANEDLKEAFGKNAVGVFRKFSEGLNGVIKSGGDVTKVLGEFGLKGDEILKVLPVLAKNSKLLGEAFDLAAKEVENATALEKEYAAQSKTLDSETTRLKNSIVVLAQKIGTEFAPAVKVIIIRLRDMFKWLGNSSDASKTFAATLIGTITAIAGVTAASAILVLGLVKVRAAFLIAGATATRAWAAASLGLTLLIPVVTTLVGFLGGLEVVIDRQIAGFTVFANAVKSGFNAIGIAINKAKIKYKELALAINEALPGRAAKKQSQFLKASIAAIIIENDKLIASNKELGKSFNDIFEEISAERAAEKVREQEAAAFAAREEAAEKEKQRKLGEEENKRVAEQEQRDIIAEQKAASFEADLAIQAIEQELFQLQIDKGSLKKIVQLKKEVKDLRKIRNKGATDERKELFKHQEEIRNAEKLDAEKRKKLKEDLAFSFVNNAVSLGKALFKEGSKAAKAIFLVEKASALASIIVNTSRSVAQALAVPPSPNIPLGTLAAAAGAAQAATVVATAITGFQDGGLVGGLNSSRRGDRHPAMLADGELVVPRRNFDEVISAMANQRRLNDGDSDEAPVQRIEIGLTDDAAEFITAQQFENSTLGTDRI